MFRLWLLIFVSLAIELATRYIRDFGVYQGIEIFRISVMVIVPLSLGKFALGMSFSDMGLKFPQLKGRDWGIYVLMLIASGIVLSFFSKDPSVKAYYETYYPSSWSRSDRAAAMFLFLFSTVPAWELFHRGFLLNGLRSQFESLKLKPEATRSLVILWVLSFEVLYHLIKAAPEAVGMLLLSPFLSWLALKSKSLWPALVFHLALEAIFILSFLSESP